MLRYIRRNIDYQNAVIVSPDAGGAKRYFPKFLILLTPPTNSSSAPPQLPIVSTSTLH